MKTTDARDNEHHVSLRITCGNDIAEIKIGTCTIYMPGEYKTKEELLEAYNEMENEIQISKPNEQMLLCGDFNAKLENKDGA